ncbi:nuclear transport factor 2 family protein [Marixanthomonas ophiurae]|uniref:Nuclear transport factor 2 family protein n=1 Tax=Marixanthomonas ophiurae TaxID=387659 RepID=A0A3E1Q7Q4_9FLAO|nr:nuclear transport factor 2 family protein [Marixanthomonas ophiurae]RFN58150.1 nuclear transport factor 2 family protein [Marixanthomonas ophiurae]
MNTNKERAKDFLLLAARGDSREAFKRYVGDPFIHHNAYFKGDGHTLMVAMEEAAIDQPNKIFEIQRTLEDGDLVSIHSRIKPQDSPEMAVMHIFKFQDQKIIELWDFGQAVPDTMVNEHGMF